MAKQIVKKRTEMFQKAKIDQGQQLTNISNLRNIVTSQLGQAATPQAVQAANHYRTFNF